MAVWIEYVIFYLPKNEKNMSTISSKSGVSFSEPTSCVCRFDHPYLAAESAARRACDLECLASESECGLQQSQLDSQISTA